MKKIFKSLVIMLVLCMIQTTVLAETNTANKKYNKLCEQADKLIKKHDEILNNKHIETTNAPFNAVLIGTFKTEWQADTIKNELLSKGYHARISICTTTDNHYFVKVMGNYTHDEALLMAKKIETDLYEEKLNNILNKAVSYTNEAISLEPNEIDAYLKQARIFLIKNASTIAETLMKKAISINPNNDKVYREIAYIYSESDDYQNAIINCNKAIEIAPNNYKNYVYRAMINFELGKNYKSAIEDYTKAIELNPTGKDTYLSYVDRATCKYGINDYEGAIQDYNKTIELNPNYDWAYSHRARAYIALKQYDNAEIDSNKAIKLNKKNDVAYNNLGIIAVSRKDYDTAITYYTKAIGLEPKNAWYYIRRGEATSNIDTLKSKGGSASYGASLPQNPYANTVNYIDPITDFTTAIELDPKNAHAYQCRATQKLISGECEEAIADFNSAIELDNKNVSAYYGRGLAYKCKGSYGNAKKDFERLLTLDNAPESIIKDAKEEIQSINKKWKNIRDSFTETPFSGYKGVIAE